MSRRSDLEVNVLAAFSIEEKSVRSRGRKVMFALGTADLMSWIADSALEGVRAARKISFGLCFASCRTDSLPRPVLPVDVWSVDGSSIEGRRYAWTYHP